MITPETRLYSSYSVDGAFHIVYTCDFVITSAREGNMGMTIQDGIDSFHFAKQVGCIFFHANSFGVAQTGVRNGNDQIGTLCLDFRDEFFRSFDDILRNYFAFEIHFVPLHDLRRNETDDAYFQFYIVSVLIFEGSFDDLVRGKVVFVVVRIFVLVVNINVCIYVWELGAFQASLQVIQTEVEFMVTYVTGIIVQQVHRFVNRMSFAVFKRLNFGNVITKRVPLEQITIVKKQAVFCLLASFCDQ
ncbi:hypothetical protein MA20_48225, partial [Bradyrhizobium japonicum]